MRSAASREPSQLPLPPSHGTELPAFHRIIAGTGRSGTTWLLDALAEANALRAVFEPLNPAGLRAAREFAHRWVPPETDWPELERFMVRALSGRLLGLWPDLRVRPDRFRFTNLTRLRYIYGTGRSIAAGVHRYWRQHGRPPLVKFIRANLMLGWLRQRFDARIVLLVRHPGGVVASTLKLGGPRWHHSSRLDVYRREPALAPWFARLQDVLGDEPSSVAAHTALWCIENAIPLEHASAWGFTPVYYERLLAGDDAEWEQTLAALALSNRPPPELVVRPSEQVSREMRRSFFDESQIGRWMTRLEPEARAEMDRVLQAFGIKVYSMEEPMPLGAPARGSSSS
jgi:hypothetical protein